MRKKWTEEMLRTARDRRSDRVRGTASRTRKCEKLAAELLEAQLVAKARRRPALHRITESRPGLLEALRLERVQEPTTLGLAEMLVLAAVPVLVAVKWPTRIWFQDKECRSCHLQLPSRAGSPLPSLPRFSPGHPRPARLVQVTKPRIDVRRE